MSDQSENPVIIDFDTLPAPAVIEEIDYDDILANMKKRFEQLAPDYAHLYEADPINKVFQSFAYREFYLRQRINAAVQAYMLPFSEGPDLDMLAAFYGVSRNILQEEDLGASPPKQQIMESDISLRSRVRDRIMGWSTAGPEYHYRYWARNGISEVKDVKVYSPEGGMVRISIMSIEGDGVPSQELLDEVSAQVGSDRVKVLTDTVEVVAGRKLVVDVKAQVYLREDTPFRVYEELVQNFRTQFNNAVQLGSDVTRSWLVSLMHPNGVYNVILDEPISDLILDDDEFPALGAVDIEYAGRKE